MSQVTKVDFKDYIDERIYMDLFEVIEFNTTVFICTIIGEDQQPRIFLEKPEEIHVGLLEGNIRVFTSMNDAAIYVSSLQANENNATVQIRQWQIKVLDLIKNLRKISNSNKQIGKKGLRAIFCAIPYNEILELDTLWSDTDDFVV